MKVTSYESGTPSWVDIGSPDPAASAAFYGALFGWTYQDMGPDAGDYRLAQLNGENVAAIGVQEKKDIPPYWTTYVSVADVDTAAKTVLEAGGQVLVEPMDVMDAGRMAVCMDPLGAPFSIWQPRDQIGAQLVNEPGTLCWNELSTRQPDAAKTFYKAVFGWGAKDQPMGPTTYTEWQLGEKTVGGMMPQDGDTPAGMPSFWLTYFAVADTDASLKQAEELGASMVMAPMDIPTGRFAVVKDPHGALFGIIALAAK